MTEYIERDSAINAVYESYADGKSAYGALISIPAADVRPVVRGEWIWDDEGYHCSECFYHAYGETGEVLSGHWKYCPNCGAVMEES